MIPKLNPIQPAVSPQDNPGQQPAGHLQAAQPSLRRYQGELIRISTTHNHPLFSDDLLNSSAASRLLTDN